ncbi:MAG: IgGFc-binding protein, partial [Myxococcota bacterium]
GGSGVEPVVCTPNEFQGCRQENTASINVCNAQGTGVVASSCAGTAVCREDVCVPANCVPQTRRCNPEGVPEQCTSFMENGAFVERFVELDPCQEGSLCEEGVCLNRCALAEQNNSYIGCEYWAVELENHLLYTDPSTRQIILSEEETAPFAVVLANTSTTYDASITVFEDEGVVASAVGSKLAIDRTPQPGVDPVRVRSEVIGADGQQIQGLSGPIEDISLPRGSQMVLILPHRRVPFGSMSVTRSAYKVVATQPVVAYQFNPFCCDYNTTNDASLLLPTSALTENYRFLSYAVFAGTSGGRLTNPWSPTLTVMATEPDTQVTVQLRPSKKEGGRPYSELVYPYQGGDERVTGPDDNGNIRVTLQPFEVFNIGGRGKAPVEDLTGSTITASNPVSVFGGHSCAYAPFNNGFCDHLESQLFPVETWGKRFALAPLKRRTEASITNAREGTYWKFLAQEDGTRIEVGMDITPSRTLLSPADEGVDPCAQYADDPTTGVFVLDAGETCSFGTAELAMAISNNPIMIGAFISSQTTVLIRRDNGEVVPAEPEDKAGDPAFFLLPPQEQYRRSYSFITPETYEASFVTVTTQPGVPITLDNMTVDVSQLETQEEAVTGTTLVHIPLDPGPHQISSDVQFGIVVYGYDDFVSYAYTGGLNLSKISEVR